MALSVPLSRSTLRVGGGSAFFVRPRDGLRLEFAGLAGEDSGSSIQMGKISAVLARAGFALRASTAACD